MAPLGSERDTWGPQSRYGVEEMILIKEVYLTDMETMRPKEKPSHRCSALIPLPVPQFSAAFLYYALGMTEKGLEAKLYLEKGSHRGKA